MAKDPFEERWRRTQEKPKPPRVPRLSAPGAGLARALGLSIEATADGAILSGYLSGLDAHLVLRASASGDDIHAKLVGRSLPAGLEIFPQTSELLAFGDVRTGDDEFDPRALIRGHPLELISVLDHEARAQIVYLLAQGLEIRNGEAHLDVRIAVKQNALRVARDLRMAAKLLAEMSLAKMRPAARLKRMIRVDPHPHVRAKAYALLDQHAPGLLDQELGRATKYPDNIRWRLRVRSHLVDRKTLVEAAGEAVADETLPMDERLQWFARLIELGAPIGAGSIASLGEETLLLVLANGTREQKIPAIVALGECGSAKAIDPLLEYAGGIFVRRKTKDAARSAIAAIEKRAGSKRGLLSLAPIQGGEVSVVKAERGTMALVKQLEDTSGRLSLDDDAD